ncbi:tripartite tricarboxylate transporter substrate binding protein [Ramlibacter sp. XY19]|uniref:Bug family tripartite tricarboxylate transporter substrate binding protein n=1 Tax=Ramlibacter paludis TaxID=2908000 RepID=UPI0023DACFCA|nr:tripartite tricarboxylate transporter substrate binding protein [Ramlibacter paludis]MCG2592425.1 tripartite tricarboxylate transporter substrate binding protein [Ramlibacter paludis]
MRPLRCSLLALLALAFISAQAAYPDKPVKLLVPYVAGSPADNVARTLADGLAKRLQQPVVVDNRPGANALIGTQALARAAADGYTIGIGNLDTHALNPLLYKSPGYDPEHDFAPVVLVSRPTLMLVGSPALQAKTGAELVALAKAQPGKLTYGTWGLGSAAHLWGIQLEQAAKIDLLHVPYQGSPAAANALFGNQIDLMFMSPAQALPSEKAGKLKIIGSTAAKRVAAWSQVPTLAEQGFAGYEGATWFGIFAPAGTPADVVDRLNRELNAVLQAPETIEKFATMAMTPEGGVRQDLAQTVAASRRKWAQTIADKKIQLEN